jgi:hypothetical protein
MMPTAPQLSAMNDALPSVVSDAKATMQSVAEIMKSSSMPWTGKGGQ